MVEEIVGEIFDENDSKVRLMRKIRFFAIQVIIILSLVLDESLLQFITRPSPL